MLQKILDALLAAPFNAIIDKPPVIPFPLSTCQLLPTHSRGKQERRFAIKVNDLFFAQQIVFGEGLLFDDLIETFAKRVISGFGVVPGELAKLVGILLVRQIVQCVKNRHAKTVNRIDGAKSTSTATLLVSLRAAYRNVGLEDTPPGADRNRAVESSPIAAPDRDPFATHLPADRRKATQVARNP